MFWSETLIPSCIVIHYIVEENSCLDRHLNPANHHVTWITQANKDFAKRLYFKYIKLLVKIRDIHEIQKQYSIGINVFRLEIKEKIESMSQNNFVEKNMLIYYWNAKDKKTLCSYQRF